ncbi:hypothetical protein KKG71_04540, partial [Patescibacteria group bacterium]|nr:hypothetical protein [Patescibacteria group bacterium]
MKINTKRIVLFSFLIGLIVMGGCSLFTSSKKENRRSYFPTNMFAYVEADMSESGKLDELTKKCSSL